MLTKTQINMRLAKIQCKIYDMEDEVFRTVNECNGLLNQISELLTTITSKQAKNENLSHNLYCEYLDLQKGIDKEPVDLTQAVGATLKRKKK